MVIICHGCRACCRGLIRTHSDGDGMGMAGDGVIVAGARMPMGTGAASRAGACKRVGAARKLAAHVWRPTGPITEVPTGGDCRKGACPDSDDVARDTGGARGVLD